LIILYFLFYVLMAIGMYNALKAVIRLPDPGNTRELRNARGKRSWGQGIEIRIVMPLARLISKLIRIPTLRRKRLADDLERMDAGMTPEVYIARSMVQALMMMVLGILFALVVAPWAMLVFVALAVLLLIRAGADEHRRIAEIDERIESELPRMIEVMQFTMQADRDLIRFFERYLLVAGPDLKPEIERLLFNMRSGNSIAALTQFKGRIRLYTVGEFVSACIGITQGLDYKDTLDELLQNVLKIEEERIKQQLDERPRKMFLSHVAVFLALGIVIGIPFAMMIFKLFEQL
jgi:hypothetical protein